MRLLTVMVVLASIGCGGSPRGTPGALPVEDAYTRIAAALARPGTVFHTVMTNETAQGDGGYRMRTEAWLDISRGVARVETHNTFVGAATGRTYASTRIVSGAAMYTAQAGVATEKREAPRCHGDPGAVLAVLLGCHSLVESAETRSDGEVMFEEKAAIALVTTGTDRGPGETAEFVDTLYIDASTYLPVALDGTGTIEHGGTIEVRTSVRYDNDFVVMASLPAAFFDPASIGYAAADIAGGLDGGVGGLAVVWPGVKVEAGADNAALELRQAAVHDGALSALMGYSATLAYGRADDEFAAPELLLREWGAEAWEARPRETGEWWDGGCIGSIDLASAGDEAELIAGYGPAIVRWSEPRSVEDRCPATAPDRYAARVRIGGTVVIVEARPGSAYGSRSAIEAVARSLKPR